MGLTYVLSKGSFVDSPPAFNDTPNIEPSLKKITISAGELAETHMLNPYMNTLITAPYLKN